MCEVMKNVGVAFEVFDGNKQYIPPGYQNVDYCIILYISMGETFRRRAWMVTSAHQTSAPSSITYLLVVSRDLVRIALTIAALNDLKVIRYGI